MSKAIKEEEQKVKRLEEQAAECSRLDLKDQEEAASLQKAYEHALENGEPLASLQKARVAMEAIEKRREGRAHIRRGYEEKATSTRAHIAELRAEAFLQGSVQRVQAIKDAAAHLTHDLAARLDQFAHLIRENVEEPVGALQGEYREATGKSERQTERLAERLRALDRDLLGPGRAACEAISQEAAK